MTVGVGIDVVFAGSIDSQVTEQGGNYHSIAYSSGGGGLVSARPPAAAADQTEPPMVAGIPYGFISQDTDYHVAVPETILAPSPAVNLVLRLFKAVAA